MNLQVQRTSNDTYFRAHDINTSLVSAENTNLENEINKDQLRRKIILNERDKILSTYSKMYLNKLKSNTMIEINDK